MDWLIDVIKNHWAFFAIGLVYAFLEFLFPLVKGQKFFRKEFKQDLFWYALNNIFIDHWLYYVKTYLTLKLGALFWGKAGEFLSFNIPYKIENPILLGIIIFFSIDFLMYWFHYFFHRISALWVIHILHHSVKQLDWLSGTRSFWLDGIVATFFASIPLAIFEVSETGIAILSFWEMNVQFLIHTNFRYSLGFLESWLNNNKAHWWHHSKTNYLKYGQNFGTYTLIWDRLFGTYYVEERLPEELGIHSPKDYPEGIILRFLYPFLKLKDAIFGKNM